MGRANMRLIYWAPRALGIAFTLFISLFALDAFSENLPLAKQMTAFAQDLFPAAILVMLLVFSWKCEWLGAGFIALGLLYMWMTGLKFTLPVYLLISGPAFLVGLLFLADWLFRRRLREPSA